MLGITIAEFGMLGLGGKPAGTFLENVVGVALSHLLSCRFVLLGEALSWLLNSVYSQTAFILY